MANQRLISPLAQSPKLNNVAVIPGTTPKSLSALFVQLNCGYVRMDKAMNVNATMGTTMPTPPLVVSHHDSLRSYKPITNQRYVVFVGLRFWVLRNKPPERPK